MVDPGFPEVVKRSSEQLGCSLSVRKADANLSHVQCNRGPDKGRSARGNNGGSGRCSVRLQSKVYS